MGVPKAAVSCYFATAMKQNHTENNSTILQLKMPVDMERIIKITDSVYSFSEVMAHTDLNRYFVTEDHRTGRPTYDRETLLKIVLFAFMEFGHCSVRRIHALCETDIRFIWLLDEMNPPSVMTIQNFIHKELSQSLENIFTEINAYIFEKEQVDTNHIYIDGTKRKANAGNYTWVWKKSCIKSRNKIFTKMTELLFRINEITRMIQNTEY